MSAYGQANSNQRPEGTLVDSPTLSSLRHLLVISIKANKHTPPTSSASQVDFGRKLVVTMVALFKRDVGPRIMVICWFLINPSSFLKSHVNCLLPKSEGFSGHLLKKVDDEKCRTFLPPISRSEDYKCWLSIERLRWGIRQWSASSLEIINQALDLTDYYAHVDVYVDVDGDDVDLTDYYAHVDGDDVDQPSDREYKVALFKSRW